ncbi:lysine-specific demethylase 8-like [Ruditapes philippinarum]|uniref:lysine-specific demethylase 8-like n=1 Tax=Ruditapes philippinarum TaxID=129788 RepID=UPI00295BDB86|nr:lysine-specific demethylase 8-like [Ruditapes philippinarum]
MSMQRERKMCADLAAFYALDFTSLYKELVDNTVLSAAVDAKILSALSDFSSEKFQETISICKILLDFIWEQLNQGHWKDVNISWRYSYTLVSVVKALSEYVLLRNDDDRFNFDNIMKSCDMGLLMGAPFLDNILARLCTHLNRDFQKSLECVSDHKKTEEKKHVSDSEHEINETVKRQKLVKDDLVESMSDEKCMKRISCPSIETFRRDFYLTETPVIITDVMEGWPALDNRKWTLDYIKKIAGCRTVPIELGSKYTDDSWSQKLMTVREFIETYIEMKTRETDIGYLAQHQLFNQIPELQNDIITPDYCYLGNSEDVDINAWFGPKGTVSPVHYDPKHNFLAQVMGEKYIRIYPQSETDNLYPHDTTLLKNTSQIDVENPNFEKFPKFRDASYVECVLKSGEMLYIPPKFWHFVKSISISFSVSFWWE